MCARICMCVCMCHESWVSGIHGMYVCGMFDGHGWSRVPQMDVCVDELLLIGVRHPQHVRVFGSVNGHKWSRVLRMDVCVDEPMLMGVGHPQHAVPRDLARAWV